MKFKVVVKDSSGKELHTPEFKTLNEAEAHKILCLNRNHYPQFPWKPIISKPGEYRVIAGIDAITETIPGEPAMLDHEGREVHVGIPPHTYELAPAVPEVRVVIKEDEFEFVPDFEISIEQIEESQQRTILDTLVEIDFKYVKSQEDICVVLGLIIEHLKDQAGGKHGK